MIHKRVLVYFFVRWLGAVVVAVVFLASGVQIQNKKRDVADRGGWLGLKDTTNEASKLL